MQLFTPPDNRATFEVVYNLYPYTDGLFLPNAYIVSRDHEGHLAHIQQKAVPATIGSFNLEPDALRERLFTMIAELQPDALEKRYNPDNRRPVPLSGLLNQKELKRVILRQVHRKLSEFLTIVVQNQLPLSWDAERKVLVKDFILKTSLEEWEPRLFFKKTGKGIQYRLTLADQTGRWTIASREVIPVTNHPAWLFVDYELRPAAHINGNMVKPFGRRDELFIPKNTVRTYFQKFILKVARLIDIEAEGFDVVRLDKLEECLVEPVRDLFAGRWVLLVKMIYPRAGFLWNDRRERRTLLDFGEGDAISLIRIERDREKEGALLEALGGFGLRQTENSYYELPGSMEDEYYLLQWLCQYRQKLETAGFKIVGPEDEERKVYLHSGNIRFDLAESNDWFDIHGTVTVGEFSFSFMDLASHIRDNNRWYRLPSGEFFLIPLEWMTRYADLARFSRFDKKRLRLARSQFTLLKELDLQVRNEETTGLAEVDYKPSDDLKATLRPYQLEGVKWLVRLYHNQLGACLADDMGLGKTLQTIAVMLYAKEQKPASSAPAAHQLGLFGGGPDDAAFLQPLNALIVLPASLVFNWEQEIKKFAPTLTVCRHTGPKRHKDERLLARFDVILTTYQTARRDVSLLEKLQYEYIVLDESQQIKNKDSKVFKAINRLEARHKISLSGTPIENSLSDLWSQMQFINPNLLGSYNFFKKDFILPIERQQDEARRARLQSLVAPYLLRRTKEEVAPELPALSTRVFYSEMTREQKRLYEKEKSAARNFLLDNYSDGDPKFRVLVLQTLTRLRQLVNHPAMVIDSYNRESGKFSDVIEHWDQVRRSGHKVLIFSSFVKYLKLFRDHFEQEGLPFAWLSGNLNAQQRERQIRRFEEDDTVGSFLISIKSGGTGLNLTAADYVFILDPWWNPFAEKQAIARAHRIGQEKNVFALKFITKDSIEEKILKLQEKKIKLAEDIIGNANAVRFSRKEIEFLLG